MKTIVSELRLLSKVSADLRAWKIGGCKAIVKIFLGSKAI